MARRPVFHLEADFTFAFAQAVAALDDSIGICLEVPQRDLPRTYMDLVHGGGHEVSLIEFKYVTRSWPGTDGHTEERFELRGHEALDPARLNFVHDVTRLEAWVARHTSTNGFAVRLTNDNRGAPPARPGHPRSALPAPRTSDADRPAGVGTPDCPYEANNRNLRGTYIANWQDYSRQGTKPGETFRWLGCQRQPKIDQLAASEI